MSECNCGNCPLDNDILGCNLKHDECVEFCKLVELSRARASEEYFDYYQTVRQLYEPEKSDCI